MSEYRRGNVFCSSVMSLRVSVGTEYTSLEMLRRNESVGTETIGLGKGVVAMKSVSSFFLL